MHLVKNAWELVKVAEFNEIQPGGIHDPARRLLSHHVQIKSSPACARTVGDICGVRNNNS